MTLSFAIALCALPSAAAAWSGKLVLDGFRIHDVATIGGRVLWAVGFRSAEPMVPVIALSEDGGATWIDAEIDVDRGRLTSIDFLGPSIGAAVGHALPGETPLIVRTVDGGTTWQSVPPPPGLVECGGIALDPGGSLLLTCVGAAGTAVSVLSQDGLTWGAAALGSPCSVLVAIDFPSANAGYAICGGLAPAPGSLWKTEDGALTWTVIALPTGAGEPVDLSFIDDDRGFVISRTGEGGFLLGTEDGAGTWTVERLEASEGVPVAVVARHDGSAMVLFEARGDTEPQAVVTYGAANAGDCIGVTEVCNGIDDDCDGEIDEDDPHLGAPCDGADSDACEEGQWICVAGALVCDDTTGDDIETCNGIDDDCDGRVDEDDPNLGTACDGPDADFCQEGSIVCSGGALECTDTTGDIIDVCNRIDDDCDGMVDEDDPDVGVPCDGTDGDLCEEGLTACTAGIIVCGDTTDTIHEVCNGVDDDCDGVVDEDDPSLGTPCDGADSDECEEGQWICVAGALVCDDTTGNDVEVCNGVDDDCDGAVDEDDPILGTPCDGADSDECEEGQWICVAGTLVCDDTTGDDIETCNGNDDDCDGAVDEDDPILGTPCDGADSDECEEGQWICVAGALVCDDTTGDDIETCNGSDDDCDGTTDEEGATGCTNYYLDEDGDGFGAPSCSIKCLCSAGAAPWSDHTSANCADCDDTDANVKPGGIEVDCANGIDDDCDGTTDGADTDCAP